MKYIESAFAWLAWVFCLGLIVLVLLLCLMPSKVTGYSLDHDGSGAIAIKKHVDWDEDKTIQLDRSVTLEQAVEIIKELNTTIK